MKLIEVLGAGLALSICGCMNGQNTPTQTKSAAQAASTVSAAHHTWHLKKVEIKSMIGYDAMPMWGIQAVPQKQVTALTMLVPSDWQFNGGPKPAQSNDCTFTVGRLAFVGISPEKNSGIISIPATTSVWSNDRSILQSIQNDNQQFNQMQNCNIQQPTPLAQHIGAMAEALSKDLEITGPMEPVPDIGPKLEASVRQANQQLAAQGAQLDVQVGRLPLRSKISGDPGEGFLTVMQVVRTNRLPNGAILQTIDYPLQVATFAPPGHYAEYSSLFTAMLDSVWVNPEYAAACQQVSGNIQSIKQQTKARLNQIHQQMALDNINAAQQQAAIRQGVQNYASQVRSNVAANRSAALDHSAQQFSLYMGDQAQYRDSSGQTVQLPSQYGHVWASSTGNTNEYILTDSASYDPNGHAGSAGWTEMQPVR